MELMIAIANAIEINNFGNQLIHTVLFKLTLDELELESPLDGGRFIAIISISSSPTLILHKVL